MGTKKYNQPQAGGPEAPLHEIIVLLVRWEKALADIVCNNENTEVGFFGFPQMSAVCQILFIFIFNMQTCCTKHQQPQESS